jgi:hypothetical protein
MHVICDRYPNVTTKFIVICEYSIVDNDRLDSIVSIDNENEYNLERVLVRCTRMKERVNIKNHL